MVCYSDWILNFPMFLVIKSVLSAQWESYNNSIYLYLTLFETTPDQVFGVFEGVITFLAIVFRRKSSWNDWTKRKAYKRTRSKWNNRFADRVMKRYFFILFGFVSFCFLKRIWILICVDFRKSVLTFGGDDKVKEITTVDEDFSSVTDFKCTGDCTISCKITALCVDSEQIYIGNSINEVDAYTYPEGVFNQKFARFGVGGCVTAICSCTKSNKLIAGSRFDYRLCLATPLVLFQRFRD